VNPALLVTLALLAAPTRPAEKPGPPGQVAPPPERPRAERPPPPPPPGADDEVVKDLDLLEHLQLLDDLEVVDPGEEKPKK
jgi:hypothetical protein